MRGVIDDPSFGIRQTELFQIGELLRLGNLMRETPIAIHHAYAFRFEMREVIQGIENSVGQAALPGGRAHAIEEQ